MFGLINDQHLVKHKHLTNQKTGDSYKTCKNDVSIALSSFLTTQLTNKKLFF